jgi:putative addiction module component (TIGR02574 family)
MAHDLKALGIEQMSVEERLELIDAIWETIPEIERLSPELRAELDRRLDEVEAGRATLISHEEVRAKFDSQFGK